MSRVAARALAPAKVNLFLRVLGRRADGFHDLETLFQAVDLFDEVRVARGAPGVRLRVDGPDLGPPEDNLVHRAARAFLERTGLAAADGVDVDLAKRIPAGAGLGGGSSDAAATLRCLAALWPGRVPGLALHEIASSLGSDVPFFLGPSGLAWGKGRGELLEPADPLPTAHLVLVVPPVHVATGGAYAALARSRGEGIARAPGGKEARPPRTWDDVATLAENDFEAVVPGAYAPVAAALEALRAAGARPALLSGSGSACFGVFPGAGEAEEAARALAASLGGAALAVRTLSAIPDPDLD
ncbi:MAG: 4-diphosphocytidyl-2-C-methyl-D-erythritol kinase [Gemmatimonadota bacterium]